MPNITIAASATEMDFYFVVEAMIKALEQRHTNCVGVMIQSGKTLTNPVNWKRTIGGGHVSPFVYENYKMTVWDQFCNGAWRCTDQLNTGMLKPSKINDVTVYFHPATDKEIAQVRNRANLLVGDKSLTYSHRVNTGYSLPKSGDCVTRSSWVLGGFSYSSPVHTGTPWALAATYELYSSPANLMSNWRKIKILNCKLEIM
ncbi:hypothetical protein M9194_07225 [Vibrio sp. S4M6]|uniref:hypothetical protein n=1 Tax=Vibrio sinus TaxID=2946865 RepID=UPI002029F1C0|nr:hypothetical protein [Vibrio sinus]MCL9781217.1 hypothetical protein [Vibrio sinus]